jgi:hypothetical protein
MSKSASALVARKATTKVSLISLGSVIPGVAANG